MLLLKPANESLGDAACLWDNSSALHMDLTIFFEFRPRPEPCNLLIPKQGEGVMTAENETGGKLTGRCLCGEIKFECTHPGEPVTICHCAQCRQWGGSPWAATSVPLEAFKVTEGENALTWYVSSDFAMRGFCRTCGSSMFWHADRHPEWSESIAIAAGCVNEPTGLKVARHIWCRSKGDYYTIDGDLPQDWEE